MYKHASTYSPVSCRHCLISCQFYRHRRRQDEEEFTCQAVYYTLVHYSLAHYTLVHYTLVYYDLVYFYASRIITDRYVSIEVQRQTELRRRSVFHTRRECPIEKFYPSY